jgi:hypothetical protein
LFCIKDVVKVRQFVIEKLKLQQERERTAQEREKTAQQATLTR